ncbi:hypothetical protein [Bradyrhizobium sp. 23AC]
MGQAKWEMMKKEEQHEWARTLLCELGILEECENHPGTYFDGDGDVERAYKVVNARISSGEITLKSGQERRDVTDLLKEVYEDNSGLDSCQECDRNFGPD